MSIAYFPLTPDQITPRKGGEKIVCLTAYSTPMARMLDAHVDVLLVGDSVGMVLYGMDNTLGVTLDMMIAHGAAVVRGASSACVVVDMPYGTYETSADEALVNAQRILGETGAAAVKLEGGRDMAATITHLVDNGVPVMGHIGLQPQSVVKDGGYKIKGKSDENVQRLLDDVKAVEEAGAFSVVVEGTIAPVAEQITAATALPTIGIGASPACDGQILVSEDMLGLSGMYIPQFVKSYADLGVEIERAVACYADEVRRGVFPGDEHVYLHDKK